MNIDKLSPAPWTCEAGSYGNGGFYPYVRGSKDLEDAKNEGEFIAIARHAFDVMLRRWWWAEPRKEGWKVFTGRAGCLMDRFDLWLRADEQFWPNPFTALVEADRWCKENVEKGKVE